MHRATPHLDRRHRLTLRAALLLAATTLFLGPRTDPTQADETRLGRVVRGFRSPGNYPEGLAHDGHFLRSNNYSNGTLYKIDPATGQKLAEFRGGVLPVEPEGLAWDGECLWTADWRTGTISRIRETSGRFELVTRFNKPANSGPAVGLGWDGTHVWLTCWPGATTRTARSTRSIPRRTRLCGRTSWTCTSSRI